MDITHAWQGLYKLYLHHLEQGRWKRVDLIKVNAALVYLQ